MNQISLLATKWENGTNIAFKESSHPIQIPTLPPWTNRLSGAHAVPAKNQDPKIPTLACATLSSILSAEQ